MATLPTFFFSHARLDRELPGNFLSKFFRDLEQRLVVLGGVAEPRLGIIDQRIEHGSDWDTELSKGLGSSVAFIAIYSPLYFKRENCGKELGVFLLRTPGLGIDSNGSLANVKNVLAIRWYLQDVYKINAGKDSIIPRLFGRMEDIPSVDPGGDPERVAAINRYRLKGMERCVDVQPYYTELLDALVQRILAMQNLPPPARPVSFATAPDAFNYDWQKHFAASGAATENAAKVGSPTSVEPQPLTSIVVFYLTNRQWTPDPTAVPYAYCLIAEPIPGAKSSTDSQLVALLSDFRSAGAEENITVFNAATNPQVPTSPDALLSSLGKLSKEGVLTAVVIDPATWPAAEKMDSSAVDTVIRSQDWTGIALLVGLDAEPPDADALMAMRGLPPRLFAIPQVSKARVPALRRALVEARGRAMRAMNDHSPGAEAVPLLRGVVASKK
jgi:hypothetical protein